MLSLQWNLNNVYIQSIGINPYKYLFKFKIESPIDRLVGNIIIPANVLKQHFIYKYLQKDVQLVDLKANILAKRRYDTMYRWKEFEVGD